MKNLVTILALVCFTFVSAQADRSDQKVELKNLNITVEVDSADDLKSTFKVKDFKTILNDVAPNKKVSFKIICNTMLNGNKSYVSYTVKGNSNNNDAFLKGIKKVRKATLKYYQNKA